MTDGIDVLPLFYLFVSLALCVPKFLHTTQQQYYIVVHCMKLKAVFIIFLYTCTPLHRYLDCKLVTETCCPHGMSIPPGVKVSLLHTVT